jgi:hypothetical protein
MSGKKQWMLRSIIVAAHLMVVTVSAKDAIGEAISETFLNCDEIRILVEGSVKKGRLVPPQAFYVKATNEAPLIKEIARFFAGAHYTIDPSKEFPLVFNPEVVYLIPYKAGKATGSITLYGNAFLETSEAPERYMIKTNDGDSVRSFQQEMKRAIEEGVTAKKIIPWPKPVQTIQELAP